MAGIDEILVPVDFSACSEDVVRQATDLAQRYQARLRILYVLEPLLQAELEADPNAGMTASAEVQLRNYAQERFPELVRVAEERGVVCNCSLERGRVPDTIVATSDRHHVGMIVMGTHGRRGPARAIMGSVAAAVVRRANCPVMTLRFQIKDDCEETSCVWCVSGMTKLRRSLENSGSCAAH
ncbi:MAG: hypothetical protein DRJ42_15800 [Deltaproteobacteria bacterium]|nr:MAG: hypothetical protein DRJ42_15800 [Deltaproteobacteria bacterium]